MNKQDFLKEVAQSLGQMDEDVQDHFRTVTRMLTACYLDDSQKAAIFFYRGEGEPASLVSVKADDEDLCEMMFFMKELTSETKLIGAGLPSDLH